MTRHKDLLLVITTFVVAPLAASAAPITVPTDLNPGDTYRLAFVTFDQRDATDVLIGPYNDFVTAVANSVSELAALGTTWKAIGSTALTDARDNTGTNPIVSTGVPLYRLDDTRIANNNADLWDGDILVPLGVDETGVDLGAVGVWTGTGITGQEHGSHGIGKTNVRFGLGSRSDDDWVALGAAGKVSFRSWYGVSGVLTVVPALSGDYNADGTVDAADYTVWRDTEGAPAGTLPNDADGGVIGAAQYNSWVANFGATTSPALAIPEPATWSLMAMTLLGIVGSRRRVSRT